MKQEIEVVSVNVGQTQTIQIGNKAVETGIFKQPTTDKMAINRDGLATDEIADLEFHGGADQAVYLYSLEDYEWWSGELGRQILPGMFGENLTLSSFGPDPLKIGDRLQINEALLEITAARVPCAKLATRMGAPDFVKRFAQAERPGAYARVLQTGEVQVGDPVRLRSVAEDYLTVVEFSQLWHARERDPALLRSALEAPLAERARAAIEYWLGEH